MLEIVYRIYKHKIDNPKWDNVELLDVYICENREDFKKYIRDIYGNDIRFRYDKSIKNDDYYCVIISEHCYNTENYITTKEFTCGYCGDHVKTLNYRYEPITIDGLPNLTFCCHKCKENYIEQQRKNLMGEENYILEYGYANKYEEDIFTSKINGYIYMITNKKTNQFYVGQTRYNPLYRWIQHLKTERFPIDDIINYKFEVLEIVPKTCNILDREKHYILQKYNENPDLSLNIMCVKGSTNNQ